MSRITGKNTKPEMIVRSMLHRMGYRFRLHDRKLPGCPDIVLPKYKTVIFVHGCFWHRPKAAPDEFDEAAELDSFAKFHAPKCEALANRLLVGCA